jgi:hypothetical protein
MYVRADKLELDLHEDDNHDDALLKLPRDPRVMRTG